MPRGAAPPPFRRQQGERYLAHPRRRAVAGRQEIPCAVAAQRQDQPRQDGPAARHAAGAQRDRKREVRPGFKPGGLTLEPAQNLRAVETQIIPVGAQEPDGIGAAGQRGRPALLERGQKAGLDLERGGNRVEIEAERCAALAQGLPDRMRIGQSASAVRRLFRAPGISEK
jgi:hypothetical protein